MLKNRKLKEFMRLNKITQAELGAVKNLNQARVSAFDRFCEEFDVELTEADQDKVIKTVKDSRR